VLVVPSTLLSTKTQNIGNFQKKETCVSKINRISSRNE